MTPRQRAIAALVIVNLFWGLSFPLVKGLNLEIQQHFEPGQDEVSTSLLVRGAAWIIVMRFAIATGLLLIFCQRLLRSVRWPQFWAGSAIGTLFFAGLLLQVIGLASIPASRSGFLTSLVVVWTPVFSTLLQRQFPRRQTIWGAIISVVGVSVLTGMIHIDSRGIGIAEDAISQWRLGDSVTSIAVLFFTFQIILIDYFGKRYESTALTPSMFGVTFILALLIFGLFQILTDDGGSIASANDTDWFSLSMQARFLIPMILLSLFSTLIAFLLMNRYQPVLTAGQAAVVYTLEPLFASSWAMFVPGIMAIYCHIAYINETASANLIVGGTILIIANAVTLWPTRG